MNLVCVRRRAGSLRRETDRSEYESRVLLGGRGGRARIDIRHHISAHCIGKDRPDQHRRRRAGIDVTLDEAVLLEPPEVRLERGCRTHRTTVGRSAQLGVLLALAHAAAHEGPRGTYMRAKGGSPFLQLALWIDRHFGKLD